MKFLSDHAGALVTAGVTLLFTLLAWFSSRLVSKTDATLVAHEDRIVKLEGSAVRHEALYEAWSSVSDGLRSAIDENTRTMSELRDAVTTVGIQIETQVTETYRLRDKVDNIGDRVVALEAR